MDPLRIVPLGGLGEIGLNSLVIELGRERLLVDAGTMFPPNDHFGIGPLTPDYRYLSSEPGSLLGIFLTHGHEDHIGALAEVLRQSPAPVYGAPLTLALAKSKLEDRGLQGDFREIGPGERISLGNSFTLEAVAMAHSVPSSFGYLIGTPQGTVLHTGDFKMDATPTDGQKTDLARLEQAAVEGLLCALSDSTNAEAPQETGSEQEVANAFQRLLSEVQGRIIVALFASNLQRIRHLLELCARLSRRVALVGRSLVRNVELGQQTGYLPPFQGLLISPEEALTLPSHQVAWITTGAQAEPHSGLEQMASGERELKISAGDTVVLSSRPIPGNERAVSELIDRLLQRGASVFHAKTEPSLHVSGHASPGQQRQLLQTVKPDWFVPIHGELHHLVAHLEVAKSTGLRPERALLVRDGDVLSFDAGKATMSERVIHGRQWSDRYSKSELSLSARQERSQMAELGLITVVAVVNGGGALAGSVHLTARGLSQNEMSLLEPARAACERRLLELTSQEVADALKIEEALRATIRKLFKQQSSPKRPNVLPVVVRI